MTTGSSCASEAKKKLSAGVSNPLRLLESMTTCTACLVTYATEPPLRAPRSMGCGHTLCTGCIATMLAG
jgi:hypothetical protein